MLLPGRDTWDPQYRFGFNGKENELDFRGIGRIVDYGMRSVDTRLGRFFRVDPIGKDYPELSSYQYASNSPVAATDIDGLEGMAGPPPGSIYAANKGLYDDLIAGRNTPRVQNSTKAGGMIVLAGALAVDAFFTKGWATRTLLGSQVFGAFEHTKASTPEGRDAQEKRGKEALADAFLTWGAGKILGISFNATASALKGLAKNRFNFAKDFYKNAGYSEERALDHTKGIDLSEKTIEKTFKKGTELEQWTYVDKNGKPIVGDYYALPGSDPTKLGIPLEGRVKTTVVLKEDTKFLQSTAGDLENWLKQGEILKGGETQFFQSNVKVELKK